MSKQNVTPYEQSAAFERYKADGDFAHYTPICPDYRPDQMPATIHLFRKALRLIEDWQDDLCSAPIPARYPHHAVQYDHIYKCNEQRRVTMLADYQQRLRDYLENMPPGATDDDLCWVRRELAFAEALQEVAIQHPTNRKPT